MGDNSRDRWSPKSRAIDRRYRLKTRNRRLIRRINRRLTSRIILMPVHFITNYSESFYRTCRRIVLLRFIETDNAPFTSEPSSLPNFYFIRDYTQVRLLSETRTHRIEREREEKSDLWSITVNKKVNQSLLILVSKIRTRAVMNFTLCFSFSNMR